MYIFAMKNLFMKILVGFSKQPILEGKHQSLLDVIRGGWYVKKLGPKLPPVKKRVPSKK